MTAARETELRARNYAKNYAALDDRRKRRFLAELVHAADVWEPGPDRDAAADALELIRLGVTL